MSINRRVAPVHALLARCLPLRAARRLGGALGRVAGALPGAGRERTLRRLRAAFPELGAKPLAALARAAAAHRAANAVDGVAASRLDARALCRRLSLSGWSHLDAAESRQRGVVVIAAGFGSWQLAALAVALYRGPVDTSGDWRGDDAFRRLAASFERRTRERLFRQVDAPDVSQRARTAFRVDRPVGSGEAVEVPFLGRTLRVDAGVARSALAAGAPLVPVFGHPEPNGWRIEVRPALEPESDVETLTARCLEVAEHEARGRPELWLGWWD